MKREKIKKEIERLLKIPINYKALPKDIKDLIIEPKYIPKKSKPSNEILYEMRYGK